METELAFPPPGRLRRGRRGRALSGRSARGSAAIAGILRAAALGLLFAGSATAQEAGPAGPVDGERVVLIGNTLADRMQHFGWLETRLQLARPGRRLTVRHLGWSADEVGLMPRPLEFGSLESHLAHQKADTILLCFGANESFAGAAGLDPFKTDLAALVRRLQAEKFNGKTPPRLVLVSPIAHEQLGKPWPDAAPRNVELERYTAAMRDSASALGIAFIDLFHPTRTLMAENPREPMTINGMHLTEAGYRAVTEILALGLGISDPLPSDPAGLDRLRGLIVEKNRQFMLRWRPVNAEYVFGRRKEPFGVLSFPPEMELLDRQIADLDKQIWEAASALLKKP